MPDDCCALAIAKEHKRCGLCKRWLVPHKHSEETKQKISAGLGRGKDHHSYGKKHSEKSIELMREAKRGEKNYWYGTRGPMFGRNQSEEFKRKLSERTRGELNNFWGKDHSGSNNGFYGRHHTEETKRKYRKKWEEGYTLIEHHKRSAGYHQGVRMRCLNSEGVFAQEMDRAGITWLYEPRWFTTSLGLYLPDFYLPEFDIWIDVKGYMRPKALAKIEAFRAELGKCLVIVFQTELPTKKYKADA